MKIDQEVKDFLSDNKDLIDTFDFATLYELANKKGSTISISEITYVFYRSGIDPLQYMTFIPSLFAYDLNLPNPVINIPDHIEYIHPYAFGRTNATKFIAPVNLKNSDLTYRSAAFSECNDLIEADFSKCDLYEEIEARLFAYCPKLKVIKFPKSLRIIRSNAFKGCTSLTSIDLSNCHKLTHIESAAFTLCDNLTTIYLPNSIEHIGISAFYTGNPITIKFDGTQQEWDNKFGTKKIGDSINSSGISD